MARRIFPVVALVVVLAGASRAEPTSKLAGELKPFLSVLDGTSKQFTLAVDTTFNVGKERQKAMVTISRTDAGTAPSSRW